MLHLVSTINWKIRRRFFAQAQQVVAQVSNLLYRRASSLGVARGLGALTAVHALPIGNRRYSRLETCATLPNHPSITPILHHSFTSFSPCPRSRSSCRSLANLLPKPPSLT